MFTSGPILNETVTVTYENPYSWGHFDIKFQFNISPSDQSFGKREEEWTSFEKYLETLIYIQDFKEKYRDILKKSPSRPIQNEVLKITSEYLSSGDHLERKFQENISLSNQSFEHQEGELIEFKDKQQMEPNKLSSEHIRNEILTLTSKNSLTKDYFGTKLQAKFGKSDQFFRTNIRIIDGFHRTTASRISIPLSWVIRENNTPDQT